MKEEIPICKDCGQPMIEVGSIGTGIREQELYQCPEDKTIAIQ